MEADFDTQIKTLHVRERRKDERSKNKVFLFIMSAAHLYFKRQERLQDNT